MVKLLRGTATALTLAGLMVACGCTATKTTPAAPVDVTGRVLAADGKPIANMVISFHGQDASSTLNRPSGALDKDGKFSVKCIPGRYKVTLANVPTQNNTAGTGELVDAPGKGKAIQPKGPTSLASYRDAGKSPWDVTIPPEGKDLTLKVE